MRRGLGTARGACGGGEEGGRNGKNNMSDYLPIGWYCFPIIMGAKISKENPPSLVALFLPVLAYVQ